MDGVGLAVPPKDATDRANYSAHGIGHMWRKRGEAGTEKLAGDVPYPQQIPQARIVPLRGGLSEGGFSVITFHKKRKPFVLWSPARRMARGRFSLRTNPSCTRLPAVGPWRTRASHSGARHLDPQILVRSRKCGHGFGGACVRSTAKTCAGRGQS